MENIIIKDEFGYVKDGLVFLSSYAGYPDRQIGEVRRTPEEALQYFRNRFLIAQTKVDTLYQQVEEAQNKGSYLTKLLQLRITLIEFDGLGNFIPLLEKLDSLEYDLKNLINTNQVKNLEIKRALVEDVRAISERNDWNVASEEMAELKNKWLKTGPVERQFEEEVESGFQLYTDTFFQNRREFFIEKNKKIDEYIAFAEDLIKQAETLRNASDVDIAFEEIKKIQQQYRTLPSDLPPKRKKDLWRLFKRANDNFFWRYNKVKGIVPKPRVNPFLEEAQKMAAEAESLPYRPDINVAADRAKTLLNDWKKLTLKTRDIDFALSNKFRLACDKVFEMNYLMRVISYRHPDFLDKPRRDQLKIQIHQMDYLVKKEKTELDSYAFPGARLDQETERKANTQKRKVAVKDMILIELRDALNKLLEV
jgi:hypothetical protein